MDRHYQAAHIWAELFFKSFTDFHPCKNSIRIRVDNENKFWALTNQTLGFDTGSRTYSILMDFFSLNAIPISYIMLNAQSLGILCIKMKRALSK